MLQLFDTLYSFDYDGDLSPYLAAEEKEDYQMALDHQCRAQTELEQRLSREERKWLETLLCNQEEAGEESGWKPFCAIRRRQGRRGSVCPSGGDWCWGSSWGHWRGGRNFAARRRGTAGGPGVPPLRNSGEASSFAVGADDLGGPRAHTVRPCGISEGAFNLL